MRGSDSDCEKKPFPLNVIRVSKGWSILVYLENGQAWNLLKPGWEGERHAPYVFDSSDEAWGFIRQMFMFCLKQQQTLFDKTDKVINCDQCGRIIRAKFFQYCYECMQENEHVLQQIWRGFYYMTGTRDGSLHKMSLLLKIPPDEFRDVPAAFQTMVQRHLDVYLERDLKKLNQPKPESPTRPVHGMHVRSRFDR